VSSCLLGAAVGSLLGSGLADSLGRRRAFLLDVAPLVAGPLLSATAGGLTAMIAGRVVTGLGIGLSSALVPLYISEVRTARTAPCPPSHSLAWGSWLAQPAGSWRGWLLVCPTDRVSLLSSNRKNRPLTGAPCPLPQAPAAPLAARRRRLRPPPSAACWAPSTSS
jgi:MFS family permease